MAETAADIFRAMADRIERNLDADFAGAVLIVPPEGDAIEILTIDPSKNAAHFWNSVKARVEIAHGEFMGRVAEQEVAMRGMYGRR